MYEALIAHLRECAKLDPSNSTYKEAADAIEELSRENGSLAKSVNEASESLRQRRPVVLCRDCVHFSARSGGSGYCGLLDIGTSQEAFCSHGENEE